MKKKIKALFLAIFIGISSFFTNIINAGATVPGVVGAENVWQLWETLAFTLGVSLTFDDSKTISYNNQMQREWIESDLQRDLANGIISQAQYDASMQNLDDIIEDANTHGVGNIINIGQDLWSRLTQSFYSKYIESTTNLYPNITDQNRKAYFDAYEGECAIYGILNKRFGGGNDIGDYIVVLGDVLRDPIYRGSVDGVASVWTLSDGDVKWFLANGSSNIIDDNPGFFQYFDGETIQVQYWQYKEANEIIVDTDNDDALASFPSYQDYVDKLNEIYELLNGQLVVTDTQEAPTILDGETVGDAVAGIQDGTTTWEDAVPTVYEADDAGTIEGENPVINKRALDEMVTGLRLNRLKTKFPFCIPSDIYNMVAGAGALDDEAPVIKIPIHIEFRGHVYYDDDEAVVIDFNNYQSVINVFRAGFFLLFLIGMIYLTIEVLHSFFVVTE